MENRTEDKKTAPFSLATMMLAAMCLGSWYMTVQLRKSRDYWMARSNIIGEVIPEAQRVLQSQHQALTTCTNSLTDTRHELTTMGRELQELESSQRTFEAHVRQACPRLSREIGMTPPTPTPAPPSP